MPKFKTTVHVFRKPAVLNPADGEIRQALHKLDFHGVEKISAGECFMIMHNADSQDSARVDAENMCKRLLVNHVSSVYTVESVTPCQ